MTKTPKNLDSQPKRRLSDQEKIEHLFAMERGFSKKYVKKIARHGKQKWPTWVGWATPCSKAIFGSLCLFDEIKKGTGIQEERH